VHQVLPRTRSAPRRVSLLTFAAVAIASNASARKRRIVLVEFRAQHRAQAHGASKLLFNTLLTGPQ
jgi:hypothetical protein